MKDSRMYVDSVGSINFFVGCYHACTYCVPTFQRQVKRSGCPTCKTYVPHPHLERLNHSPPKTPDGTFIFYPSASDWAFIPEFVAKQAIEYMCRYKDRSFLCQSKNPDALANRHISPNAIIGVTIETDNAYLTDKVSAAPTPKQRYDSFKAINHPRKMLTIEPIMDFSWEFIEWIKDLNPWRVYVGYNSHPEAVKLVEPSKAKTLKLINDLRNAGIVVKEKLIREAI